jgi:hypothetical protein
MASDSSINQNQNLMGLLFSNSTISMLLCFLGSYIIAFLLFGAAFRSENSESMIHRTLDLLIFGIVMLYLLMEFYNVSQSNSSNALQIMKTNAENVLNNPYTIIHYAVFLILFHVLLFLFKIPVAGAGSPYFVSLFMGGAWIVLSVSMIVWFFNKFLNISLFDSNLWNDLTQTQSSVKVDITGNIIINGNVASRGNVVLKNDLKYDVYSSHDEVFNVSNNLYTYEDAKAVCTAYGARLATYDEVEEAYNKGGEWCNYGWSQDQLALFPTQKLTWFKLQKNPAHKNDCGRPGVNGGYMENPYIRFGVNCYGKKPAATDKDKQEMDANKEINVPKTPEELLLDKKVQFWKENADKLLNINSFNYNQWSEY